MLRPAEIQPFHPQQQIFPVRHRKRHRIPAAVVERFGGVLAKLEEETCPVGHFADNGEARAVALEVVEGADAVGAEDALVPG